MVRSTARSKVTWGAVVAALVVGLALLLMLTSQSIHPQPAQAAPQQTAPKVVLTVDGQTFAEFSSLDEAVSTIELPDQPQPASIVLERPATSTLELSVWHDQARAADPGFKRNVTLVFLNSNGAPTLRLLLRNAWPAEYHLEQQGTQVVERIRLTADSFQRVAP